MIVIPHPIKQLIVSQHDFLLSMIERFPFLLEEWISKQEKEVETLAKEEAKGDFNVYSSIWSSDMSRTDSCYNEELIFNNAMLIMIYSYYESILCRIAKECDAKDERPSTIAGKFNKTIDGEYRDISEFLYDLVLPLRNQLCHNNNGTLYKKSNEKEKARIKSLKTKKYISEEDGRIHVLDRSFIKKILEDEYKLLLKLAELCGYKTTVLGRCKMDVLNIKQK